MNNKILQLTEEINTVDKKLVAAMQKEYPEGSYVHFYFIHGQVNPSRGTVIYHHGGTSPNLRVRLEDTPSKQVRDVPLDYIID